ncbi:unnamed protein product [Bursaphelenchus xylophilus]|uniref:(pine wood nematode) hypothetical protein n=1 Tax=Bursaphelenchus xylophilus TaxID=6326 RepID=A0A811K451_BURXY|nr:unnamed protein product [Bursaphelenchus xylophilus]CAG9085791.1 unnamed protein product [Bursaphelenchus xylophilus]
MSPWSPAHRALTPTLIYQGPMEKRKKGLEKWREKRNQKKQNYEKLAENFRKVPLNKIRKMHLSVHYYIILQELMVSPEKELTEKRKKGLEKA